MKTDLANSFEGKIVAFVPRGQDVEMRGKVTSSYVSDLDKKEYLKIKAEDGKTYTKQIKYVEVIGGEDAVTSNKTNNIPDSLLKEIEKLANPSKTKELEVIVKRLIKKELSKMVRSLK